MRNDALKKSVLGFFLATQLIPAPCFAIEPPTKLARLLPWTTRDHGKRPQTASDPCVEELAKNIDWLENRLNLYGTVVAKAPDVWGEARLTAHRQEFEEVLKAELRQFNKNQINGAEFVSDQAFLSFALAIKGQQAGVTPPTANISANVSATSASVDQGGNPTADIKPNFANSSNILGLANGSNVTLGSSIQVEQTEVLDQLARYVNHLHAIRRINEGDDTSDSPGYAMNLVRIPVSIMPGHHTKHGYGAEITMTATPYYGPELLPVAFRDFVINDLIDQLAIPIARYINANPQKVDDVMNAYSDLKQMPLRWNQEMKKTGLPPGVGLHLSQSQYESAIDPIAPGKFFNSKGRWTGLEVQPDPYSCVAFRFELETILQKLKTNQDNLESQLCTRNGQESVEAKESLQLELNNYRRDVELSLESSAAMPSSTRNDYARLDSVLKSNVRAQVNVEQALKALENVVVRTATIQDSIQTLGQVMDHLPAGTTRRSTLPFPPTQLFCNFGMDDLANFTLFLYGGLRADVLNREVVHVTDIQAYLREELGAAYELLKQDTMLHWWDEAANGQSTLVQDIRLRRTDSIAETRKRFIDEIQDSNSNVNCRLDRSSATMAWCVYVESVLLNERLVDDVRETLGTKPNTSHCTQWLPYFGPNPPEGARIAFNEYVRVRWPIRVFALDPQVNEQNIADVRSIYRQMQMAIALAFSSREVGLSAALQAMRKLQRDRATVDLNRTATGFGHGDDTFGWRFFPRFQTPPVEGNATVLFRDLIVGGPTDKHLEKSKEIEPGMRECTAIVLMPSFVPHVTFTTRSNWFKLGKQGITADSVEDTMTYSRAIKQMEVQANECVRCAHLYRDGEVDRLIARVHQLDRKLPLQTLECAVPIENSFGGFEIFSSGTRELAPELNGWYGSPGYDPARGGQMFFAGDSFSVPNSRLIVGNQQIPFRLLSRQIMEVTLPAGLSMTRDRRLDDFASESYAGYLDAHIATPYGVSGHLLIPVLRPAASSVSTPVLAPTTVRIRAIRAKASNVPQPTIERFITPESFQLFDVTVPIGGGLEGSTLPIKLATTSGADRLSDVGGINLIASQGTNRFVMSANDLANQFKAPDNIATKLGAAIKDHIEYVLRNNINSPTITYETRAVLGNGAVVSGSITIIVVIE